MNFTSYLQYFESILQNVDKPTEPYNDPEFMEYTKLNWSRLNRWVKTGELQETTLTALNNINTKQKWVLISEPWCGDAAHAVPFIVMMAKVNPNIELDIQLRDSGSEIDNYLTNGSKSIPLLIIRDENGKDITKWGPRPIDCQTEFSKQKAEGMEMKDLKVALQKWYNNDKGVKIQEEIIALF
jgi:glutaredoxin-related protein